ncbi:MAG: hypothetical protein F4138_06305 [Acidimicrobiia bacterium]|nr:hypothetical protein [Acidimicrobiia bacterium]
MTSQDNKQADVGEDVRIATEMYDRWRNGEPKSALESEYFYFVLFTLSEFSVIRTTCLTP